jgi:hypothetical protein
LATIAAALRALVTVGRLMARAALRREETAAAMPGPTFRLEMT